MSNRLGYEGICTRCEQAQRIYYFYADSTHKQRMVDGSIMQEHSNCPSCVTSQLFQTPHTMRWQRRLSPKEVEADLTKLNTGINIDWDAVDSTQKEYDKNDIWLENQEHRVKEFMEWKRKTEGGTQKHSR
jgi:hypothetical protein